MTARPDFGLTAVLQAKADARGVMLAGSPIVSEQVRCPVPISAARSDRSYSHWVPRADPISPTRWHMGIFLRSPQS